MSIQIDLKKAKFKFLNSHIRKIAVAVNSISLIKPLSDQIDKWTI